MKDHMNGEFSVGLSNTISSLLNDDEDYQIVLASELLNYLSNKGFYPPEDINKIMFEILKSKKSNDPAVVYNIFKVLNSLKDQTHYIESDNWDLLISSFTSLNVHLTNDSLNLNNNKSTSSQQQSPKSSSKHKSKKQKTNSNNDIIDIAINNITNTSSSRGNGLIESREAKLSFLSSKALTSYYISIYDSLNLNIIKNNLLPIDHPLFKLFQSGNRVATLLEEMMLIIRFCDYDTFQEIIKFFMLIFKLGGASWEENLLPIICQKFRLIKISKRKALFCQLLPNGSAKNKILKGLLEDAHPTGSGSEYVGNFPSKRNKAANEKELIEKLAPYFNKIRTKALRRSINKNNSNINSDEESNGNGDDDYDYDDLDNSTLDGNGDDDSDDSDDSDDNLPSSNSSNNSSNSKGGSRLLFLNGFDIQGPIDKLELFVIMVCQLYQSAIVTTTQKFINNQKLYENSKNNNNNNNTTNTTTDNDTNSNESEAVPPIDQVSWSTVFTDFKELSQAITISVKGVCKNQNLIDSNLKGIEIILKSKTTSFANK